MTPAEQHDAAVPAWPPRAPDDAGWSGVAWLTRWEWKPGDPVDWTATLARWVVQTATPGQLLVDMIHLRPIEGASRAPVIRSEGATHELIVSWPREYLHDPDGIATAGPQIINAQVCLASDADAQKLAHWVVHRLIAHGEGPVQVAMLLANGVRPACSWAAS